MKDTRLILFLAIGLFAASLTLLARETMLADPTRHDWWSLSFVSAQPEDASFSVLNFGSAKTFFATVSRENEVIDSFSFTLASGAGQTILAANPDKNPSALLCGQKGVKRKKILQKEKRYTGRGRKKTRTEKEPWESEEGMIQIKKRLDKTLFVVPLFKRFISKIPYHEE
ncbi:MAG: hypothetical protein IPL87_03040 [Candidatus Moraniibacteriota bacterium]|nr:MAG: hypothetical protein IPL87_03040 [Candidatus Moranbacteria bacterium]